MKPDEKMGPLLRDVFWLVRGLLDARLEPIGLSQARWQPILALHRAQKPLTQSALAAELGIESPTLVRMLDRLSADGWLQRVSCPNDRRAYHVVLTDRSKDACADIEEQLRILRRDLYGVIDPDELATCVRVLEQVKAHAGTLQPRTATAA
ncbi:MarR family winged helix-turn-helix transcriptional regulator [Solimonas sp. K1W22B-7]|uniref:MarR family winged helix-turn-helix transcriptional regulator n=1 Tax=Solimonas sp. K1W22B-7 TaxID=2303331 RepID=UPI0013C4976E|nr:MarR family transcriptional regulator [Solimonas sp. K1W22B-7]